MNRWHLWYRKPWPENLQSVPRSLHVPSLFPPDVQGEEAGSSTFNLDPQKAMLR